MLRVLSCWNFVNLSRSRLHSLVCCRCMAVSTKQADHLVQLFSQISSPGSLSHGQQFPGIVWYSGYLRLKLWPSKSFSVKSNSCTAGWVSASLNPRLGEFLNSLMCFGPLPPASVLFITSDVSLTAAHTVQDEMQGCADDPYCCREICSLASQQHCAHVTLIEWNMNQELLVSIRLKV